MLNHFAETVRDLLNLTLSPAQAAAFRRYSDELRAWNDRVNLIAITDPAEHLRSRWVAAKMVQR